MKKYQTTCKQQAFEKMLTHIFSGQTEILALTIAQLVELIKKGSLKGDRIHGIGLK